MAKSGYATVEEYIALQPKAWRALLQRVRMIVLQAIPKAEEGISYQMPTYKLHGRSVLHFALWKEHFSLYPAGSATFLRAFKSELAAYEVSKGTVRFPLSQPIPEKLIARMAKFRAKELAKLQETKTGKQK